jgi:hypothetical protein
MAVEGMKLRGWEIKDLKSIAIDHKITKIGAALAAVVLWDSSIWHGNSDFKPQMSNFDVWT